MHSNFEGGGMYIEGGGMCQNENKKSLPSHEYDITQSRLEYFSLRINLQYVINHLDEKLSSNLLKI